MLNLFYGAYVSDLQNNNFYPGLLFLISFFQLSYYNTSHHGTMTLPLIIHTFSLCVVLLYIKIVGPDYFILDQHCCSYLSEAKSEYVVL